MSMKEISKYYKEEVERLTSKDFMLESLSRHCASGINLIDALSTEELKTNESAKETAPEPPVSWVRVKEGSPLEAEPRSSTACLLGEPTRDLRPSIQGKLPCKN